MDHEVFNDTVEGRSLVSEVLLASSQSSEVLDGLRDSLAVKTHHNATHWLVAMADVEVDLVGDLWAFSSFSCLGEEDKGDGEDE